MPNAFDAKLNIVTAGNLIFNMGTKEKKVVAAVGADTVTCSDGKSISYRQLGKAWRKM